jgi:hypothetical protein
MYTAECFARISGKEKGNQMGMLVASCDESGKLADPSCVTFAGWLADITKLNAMSQNRDELLDSKGLAYIKMSEVLSFRGEFSGWRDRIEERDRLLLDLICISREAAVCFVAATMPCEQFKSLPNVHRAELVNPQYCGFETCIDIMVSHAIKRNQQLQIWCDSTEEYAETCIKLYRKLRMQNQTVRDTCVSITFGEDQHFPPLQAADVWASCVRLDYLRSVKTPDPLVAQLMELFGQNRWFGSGFMTYGPDSGLGGGIISLS